MRHHARIADLAADAATAFVEDVAPGMLLLRGDPRRPEATDVAVVLSELADTFPNLRAAVASTEDEAGLRARFAVTSFPALLFVKGGAVVSALVRMHDWSAYDAAARSLEAP